MLINDPSTSSSTARTHLFGTNEAKELLMAYKPFLWKEHRMLQSALVGVVGIGIFAALKMSPAVTQGAIEGVKYAFRLDLSEYISEVPAVISIFASTITLLYTNKFNREQDNWKERTAWKLRSWQSTSELSQEQCQSIALEAPEECCKLLDSYLK